MKQSAIRSMVIVAIGIASLAGFLGWRQVSAQSATTDLSFKTASIKLNEATACCAMTFSKDRFVATESATYMIMFAYANSFH